MRLEFESSYLSNPIRHAGQHLWKLLISVFVLSHIVMIGLWNLPSFPLRDKLVNRYTTGYLTFTRLDRTWTPYAPDVTTGNYHIEAEITFRDGSQRVWPFPRVEKLSQIGRMIKAHYGCWIDKIFENSFAWPDTARYIARLHATDPANPPQKVVFVQYWGTIPPPVPGSYQPIPKEYEQPYPNPFFTYDVVPEDLS